MGRLSSSIQKDTMIQARKNLYAISLGLAVIFSLIFCFILKPDQLKIVIPAAMLLIVGGSTLLFVGALIMDEKESGVLSALVVSPLTSREYLLSKIITLTFLSTLEVGIMTGIPLAYFHGKFGVELPNILLLAVGIVILNMSLTALGIIVAVRFKKITDYIVPILVVMIFLQVPIIYFSGIMNSHVFLAIPSSASVMIIRGAFGALEPWQWIYAGIYNAVIVASLLIWAVASYEKHIVRKMR